MSTAELSCLVDDIRSRRGFGASYDVLPFPFEHTLHFSEHFTLPALCRLAERLSPHHVYLEAGETRVDAGWSSHGGSRSLLQCLDEMEQANALVMLKRVQEDPEYAPIFAQVRESLSTLSGIDMLSRYRDGLMTVLITSPGRITPYHMDGDSNLLMQVRGTKRVSIFDGRDREVLPASELEAFWSGDIHATRYKPELQDRAWIYDLGPGKGVANPVTFPHWVQNGPDISISVSVNFKRVVDDEADAHKMNHRLRTLGLHPLEPGSDRLIDHLKGMTYRMARRVKAS